MTTPSKLQIRSDIGWSDASRIHVRGLDLCEDLLGKVNLGDMAFLEIAERLPSPDESRMFNAVLVTLAEHGIVPSTLAARLTYAGAPEAMQAAVAAGILGLGSVFVGSTEGASILLSRAMQAHDVQGISERVLREMAHEIVRTHRDEGRQLPGIGHPIHRPHDPRTVKLAQIAHETGFRGRYMELMLMIGEEATAAYGKPLPVNATGAVGAICCEMGFEWRVARGLGIMARAVGIVGHLLEESRMPMALEVWKRTEGEASSHLRCGV